MRPRAWKSAVPLQLAEELRWRTVERYDGLREMNSEARHVE
jgi:hypothetical protein